MKSPKEMSKAIRMKKKSHYDDGGQVADPEKLESAQESMRKAFGYAYGGRVLDERPGLDQGPEDSDLQDREIEREDETTEALDENHPKEHGQGQHESNAAESTEETHEQKTSNGSMEGRAEADRELLRNVRKERIRSRMMKR